MCLYACMDKKSQKNDGESLKEVDVNSILLKDSILDAFVKEREWMNFYKLETIGSDTILYKRNDLNINTIGLLTLLNVEQGGIHVSEIHVSNDFMHFFPKTMRLYRAFFNKNNEIDNVMVFKTQGKDNEQLVSSIFMKGDSIASYVSFRGDIIPDYKINENDRSVYVKGVRVSIDNIRMEAIVCIDELGIRVHELRGENGVNYGYGSDVENTERRKILVNRIRGKIVDKIVKDGIVDFFNNVPTVGCYVNEGKYNAMRFNDKYRNNDIDICGIVNDIDEPWGSRYKYRVKLDGCDVLTDNRSVLDLNKGDYVYIHGVCSDFNSNSYQLTVIDGFVLTEEYVGDFVRTMMNRTEDVLDERLKSIDDYNIYYENALVVN